jgi:hypothetical protein
MFHSANLEVIFHENKKNGNARLADHLHFHLVFRLLGLRRIVLGLSLFLSPSFFDLFLCQPSL